MESIELRVQEGHTVTLKSLASAGYQWTVAIGNPHLVQVDRLPAARAVGDTPPKGSLDEQFRIIALAPGETNVLFTQRRPFEQAKPPHAQFEITIRVKAP